MKTILVTGGAGFIGSHTCLLLLENKIKVYVIDSFENSSPKALSRVINLYSNGNKSLNSNLKVYKGNLCDKNFLEEFFQDINKRKEKIDGIIHFAGVKAVSESVKEPLLYWETNLMGTINLLEMMKKYECRNLVFSGSATIYDQNKNCSLKENSNLAPLNPYGNTKLSVEILLNDVFKSSLQDWKFASLRYFNPIGAHPSGMIGESPKGKSNNVFPLIANTAMGIQKKLQIYGDDWPTKDGTAIRDYIHVMDVAESHIKILNYLTNKKSAYLKVNIGTGIGTSVLDLVKAFEKVNNVKVPYVFSKRRPGDACSVVADNSYLISEFNIIPKKSIDDMCIDGWKWKTLNPNGF